MRVRHGIRSMLAGGAALCFALPAAAQNAAYQQFLQDVCGTAQSGELENRCQTGADGGDNRGQIAVESQESLNPSQPLGTAANAAAETRARLEALKEHLAKRRQETDGDVPAPDPAGAIEAFGLSGFSLLAQVRGRLTDRGASSLERGFEADAVGLQVGGDYRITDDWLVGALVGYDRRDSEFDGDGAGVLFAPPPTSGGSDADSYSLSVFTTRNFAGGFYAEALATVTASDYRLSRDAAFLQPNRGFQPQVDVRTTADTQGRQYAVSVGAGWQQGFGAFSTTLYGRIDHDRVEIDGYAESGGSGLAMRFDDLETRQTYANLGARLSYAWSTGFGVLLPQVHGEYVHGLDVEAATSTSAFVQDATSTRFSVTGDEPDGDFGRLGFSLLAVLPNGWLPFVAYEQDVGRAYFDEIRLTAGLRAEF